MLRFVRLSGLALGLTVVTAATALAASSPSVTKQSADRLGQTSARLNAQVNPNGAATTYFFQYGYSPSYTANTPARKAGSGTKFVAVNATITGLLPGTVYHFHIVALNSHGEAAGPDRTFKTTGPPPPQPTTLPASSVTTNSATMNGTINPETAVTGYEFQYGPTTSYGSSAPFPPQAVSPGSTPVPVSYTLTGLASGAVFHYRLVAYHGSAAISYGADQSFLTEPSPRPQAGVHGAIVPHRARHRPFTFTIAGRISGPSWIPSGDACTGTVTVRFFLGKRGVRRVNLVVAPDCSFAGQTTFNHKPGRGARNRRVTLRVTISFRGNGYLAPRAARNQKVTIG